MEELSIRQLMMLQRAREIDLIETLGRIETKVDQVLVFRDMLVKLATANKMKLLTGAAKVFKGGDVE
jgi:hypothetical protein